MSGPSSSFMTVAALVRAALPIGLFYLTEILVGLTDLAVVGSLGATELAAVGLAKTLLLSVMVIGFAVLSIGTVLMAERPAPDRCGAVLVASMAIALPLVVVSVLLGHMTGRVLRASGYEAGLVAAFEAYASILAWAIAPALLIASLKNVQTAIGRTGVMAWLSIGIVLGNLATSLLLVHGVAKWQGLGVAGAAWPTVAVNTSAAALLLGHAVRSGALGFGNATRSRVAGFASEILRLGWAAGAQQALESTLFVAVLYLLGFYSPLWLAAGTVVFAVMELNYAASSAIGEVLAARIAAKGTCGKEPLLRLLGLGVGTGGATAAVLALTVGVFAEPTVFLFSSASTSEAMRSFTADLLQRTAPVFLFDAWQIVCVHALRGLRRTVWPMVLSTSCYWLLGLGGGAVLAGGSGFGGARDLDRLLRWPECRRRFVGRDGGSKREIAG